MPIISAAHPSRDVIRRSTIRPPGVAGRRMDREGTPMLGGVRVAVPVIGAIVMLLAGPATAQKSGGILKLYHRDSPASLSTHEEATVSAIAPAMAIFNNLVLFDQHEKQNRPEFIQPELADSWSWNADHTRLSFKLHQGVKWHDGQPFTAKDVKCTWDLLTGKGEQKLRLNPRKTWYQNLDQVQIDGDYAVTF